MDPLPDLNFAGHSEPLTISEQALLDKSKRDFKDQLAEALSQLKHSISTIASTPTKTVDPTLKASIETLGKLLGQHLSASLSTNRTKRELDSLQDVINSAEKLAFLVRYFNWENEENYVKFLSSQAPKVHSIIYAFNVFVQNLIKNIIQHIEVDPQVLLRFLKHLQEQETSAVPLELIGLRTPIKRKRTANELSRVILLDYYYLERSYRSLQDLLINGAASQTQKKIRSALQPEGGAAPASDIFGEDELHKKSSENKVLLELQKELERINQLKGEDEILNYLFKSKNRIDQTISQAETSIQTLEKEALTHVTEVLSRGELDDDSPKKTYTPLVLEKVDEIISAEVKGYSIGGKTLKQYWQEISERIRLEVAAMISMEKFLLQASYLSIYFEEKFVVFHAGRGQFMQENFAKLIEDFSNTANKEYKYMAQLNNSQGLHPLYYCYVAENFQDFYLVEYHPANPVLKVYLTAAPMLATLHKHLAKLDITKISKKSFSITRLNFFDTDVGVELRNLFLDPKNRKQSEDSDDEEDEEVPKHFRYFVFITIFLLHNSPIQTNAPEIVFGVQDLINFYNYLAEFQSVTLKHQEDSQPIPTTFEFYYPFVNMRQTRDQYLIFNKKDPSRDIGLTSVRNICYQNKDFLQYGELLSEEKFYNESFFNNEVLKYLKRNETKPSFNFDGHPYLIEYLKRIPQTSQGQASDNAMTVFSRVQTQSMVDVFLAGDRNIDTVRGLEDSSKSAKVYLMFSGAPESLGLLMIAYDRVKNKCTVYLWDSKDTQEQEVLHEFVDYIKGSIRGEKGGLKTEGTTKYVVCRSRDEVVINYFRNHHFPYTYFFEQEALGVKGSLEIDLEDLVEPFKSFLSINISENNLDVFKVYSRILEDKMFKHWEIVNIGVMWKFSELKYTLQTLAEKLMEEQVDHVLLSFTYIGALGSKVYYLYLQEMVPEESKEETKMDTQSQEVTYLIDVYSLAYNLDLDDREILTIIYYCCKIISKPRLVFNAAYRINPRNNILLYTQVEITLTTLGYLVHFCNLSMERAFQKISRSIVSHYEILESLMSQTDALNQTEGGEQPGNIESNDVKESAIVEPNLTLEGGDKQKTNLKLYQSFFEDILKEVQFKKKLELEVPGLLKEVDFEAEEESESMDMGSFLNILNCEIISPLTYFFATNEMFTKRVITNENNILTDKSVYSFLIKELASAKVKYEEALEIKYQGTTVYFICPLNLLHVHKIPLVKYNVESHQITYYYLKSAHEPKLNDNIAAFIDTLSLKLASTSNNPQTIKALSTRELKITPCPIVISEDLQDIVERQYPVIIKALIRYSSRQDLSKEHSLVLNTERFNTFMCEYAEDLLQSVETSKIKSNYRYLSNMFLQKESPITKKIALLTFLNGTASIEQLTIIKDCIKTFRDDFNKIEGIEHAFFCFNVSVKNSLKHYLLHLSGHSGKPVKLKVFTNVLGDTDSVIDRMIQAYCLEDGESSELSIFKINIPNAIFTRYLEISSFLIAHAVCNDVEDSNEYCAELALSPIHYLNELKKFETKCEILNLFKEPTSPGRV